MDRKPVSGIAPGDKNPQRGKKRRASGLQPIERDGYWHIHGTLKLPTGSVRVRRSTGIVAGPENYAAADAERYRIEKELRNEAIHGIRPSLSAAAAAYRYLKRPRRRPIGASTVRILKEIGTEFGLRELASIQPAEWVSWVEKRQAGNKPETRERFITAVLAFLNWAHARPQNWLSEVPAFDRDKEARNPTRRARRRVQDLRPELIRFIISHASPHLKGQLAVQWSTGARVSSVLFGCRVCDLILGGDRNQITFHETKNGRTVTAALHPVAVEMLKDYLAWRGNLHDREAPLFLTHKHLPYADNGRDGGGQTKTAFDAMKRRAAKALREAARKATTDLRAKGQHEDAGALESAAEADASLIGQITPHWFRHLLATKMLHSTNGDLGTTAAQMGWADFRSAMGYVMDVPAHRHQVIDGLDFGENTPPSADTFLTRTRRSK